MKKIKNDRNSDIIVSQTRRVQYNLRNEAINWLQRNTHFVFIVMPYIIN